MLLAACQQPAQPEPSRPSPTPPQAPRVSAAEQFAELEADYTAQVERLQDRLDNARSLTLARLIWADFADTEQEFLGRLEQIEFPADVSGLALELRTSDRRLLELEQRLAAEQSDAAYFDLLGELEDANRAVSDALMALRSRLGIRDTPEPSTSASRSPS
jgi:hypothetical protein